MELTPVFSAIDDFVKSLVEAFPPSTGNHSTEGNLLKYSKMIEIIKKSEPDVQENSIKKLISGFEKFFKHESVQQAFESGNLSAIKNVPIVYGDSQKVKLEIQRFIRSDQSTRECITDHLRNIASLMKIDFTNNSQKTLKELLGKDAATEEGEVIQNMFNKFGSKMNGASDPMSLAAELMAEGGMDDIIKMTQSAKIKPQTIKRLLVNIINNVIPDDLEDADDSAPSTRE